MKKLLVVVGLFVFFTCTAASCGTPDSSGSPMVTFPPQPSSATLTVDQVKQLITSQFGSYAPIAIKVAFCESSLQDNAYNTASGAAGLFQFLPGTWAENDNPVRDQSPYDASANVQAAWWLFKRDGYTFKKSWACG